MASSHVFNKVITDFNKDFGYDKKNYSAIGGDALCQERKNKNLYA